MVFVCIFPVGNDVEHLFMHLFAIPLSSLINCLFKSSSLTHRLFKGVFMSKCLKGFLFVINFSFNHIMSKNTRCIVCLLYDLNYDPR